MIFTFHLSITVIMLFLLKLSWWPIALDIIVCYFVITCVVYDKVNNDPRFFLMLLIKNLEAIPKFFEELKNFYQSSQFVTNEINKKEPQAIYVKFNPVRPKFLESFLELPVDFEDDDILEPSYWEFVKTVVIVIGLIVLIGGLNFYLVQIQMVFFQALPEYIFFLKPILLMLGVIFMDVFRS